MRPYVPPLVTSDRFPPGLLAEQDTVPVEDGDWLACDFAETAPLALLRIGPVAVRVCGMAPAVARLLHSEWSACVVRDVEGAPLTVELSVRQVEKLPFATPVAVVAHSCRASAHLLEVRGLAVRLDLATGQASALVAGDRLGQELANLLRMLLWAFAPGAGSYLVRAAAVDTSAGTVLLVGPSQAGKSTAARLAGARRVLSDDAVLVEMVGARAVMTAVGLRGIEGSAGLDIARVVTTRPVAGFVCLRKATGNGIRRLSPGRAVLELQTAIALVAKDPMTRRGALELADRALQVTPGFELSFSRRDGSFWPLVEAAVTFASCPP